MQAKGPTPGHQCNPTQTPRASDGIRFRLGMICATPGALAFMSEHAISGAVLLARHQMGDWGDLCPEDRAANDRAVVEGGRILSAYDLAAGKLWIITEYDRSATTVLLPEEY
jgi:hypothetical protein